MEYTVDTNTQEVIETIHPADVVRRRTMQSYAERIAQLEDEIVTENTRHTNALNDINDKIAAEQAGFDAGINGGLPAPII